MLLFDDTLPGSQHPRQATEATTLAAFAPLASSAIRSADRPLWIDLHGSLRRVIILQPPSDHPPSVLVDTACGCRLALSLETKAWTTPAP